MLATYLGIWTISLISFWFFDCGSDAMVTFNKVNMPELIMLLIGAMISLVGMGAGVGIRYVSFSLRKKKSKHC